MKGGIKMESNGKIKLGLLPIVYLLFVLVEVGLSQETEPTYKLGEIVVTATKTKKEIKPQAMPKNISMTISEAA